MARRSSADEKADDGIRSEDLEPIGKVLRELTRPDGSTVVVEVPVYPPFRLRDGATARPGPRARKAPSLKRKPKRAGKSGGDA